MKIKGAIFDMDGVLLNSEILYQRFWLEALHYFNYPATERITMEMVIQYLQHMARNLLLITGCIK